MRDAGKLVTMAESKSKGPPDIMKNSFVKHAMPMMATSAAAGIILSILAPYGTSAFTLPTRFTYWMGLCMAGGIGATSFDLLSHWRDWRLKSWQKALGQSICATGLVSLILLGFTLARYGWPGWFHFTVLPFFVWVISILICGIGELSRSRRAEATPHITRPAIFDRLKPALREAELYALSSEDHYVRAITSKGDDLILMRLSDAIKETAPLKGLQTHRSWWVAEAGVEKVQKQDGKLSIRLKNDTTSPVSRSNGKALREAGWA